MRVYMSRFILIFGLIFLIAIFSKSINKINENLDSQIYDVSEFTHPKKGTTWEEGRKNWVKENDDITEEETSNVTIKIYSPLKDVSNDDNLEGETSDTTKPRSTELEDATNYNNLEEETSDTTKPSSTELEDATNDDNLEEETSDTTKPSSTELEDATNYDNLEEETSDTTKPSSTELEDATNDDNLEEETSDKTKPRSTKLEVVSNNSNWEEETRNRMANRSANLKKACTKNKGDDTITKGVNISRFFYSRNLLACVNAKVGSQTMAQLFFKLYGLKEFRIYGKDRLKILASKVLGYSKATDMLRQTDHPENSRVKNFMVVRNPLDRLVSVYREKYWGGKTFLNTRIYLLKALGKINDITYQKGKRYLVTFTQFLNLITKKTDRHWIPIHKHCAPCYNHYDYFLDLETFNDDLRYIYKQAGINVAHDGTHKNNSTRKAGTKLQVEDYFKGVPKSLLRKVHNMYRMDFELFGYEIPDFLKLKNLI